MKITGKVHCFFEQSGTFKNEFIKLGFPAEDYDIQNNFGETDNVIDLFNEIDTEYKQQTTNNKQQTTVFDRINPGQDLIVAFYPCIYFCATSQMAFYLGYTNYRKLNDIQKIKKILERSDKRKEFFDRLLKFVSVCLSKNIRMIFENPWSEQTYLKANFLKAPDVVDMNRMERGDFYKKPTAYWFWNCEPTHGFSRQNDKKQKTIMKAKSGIHAGICSEERSLISSDYARNWICDFVISKDQHLEPVLFDFDEE
jgi:hypothetical protein